jgi:hypothetical protein
MRFQIKKVKVNINKHKNKNNKKTFRKKQKKNKRITLKGGYKKHVHFGVPLEQIHYF